MLCMRTISGCMRKKKDTCAVDIGIDNLAYIGLPSYGLLIKQPLPYLRGRFRSNKTIV